MLSPYASCSRLTSKWGQVILRHTELAAYRCFLPDLAGFTGFYCTGPSPYFDLGSPIQSALKVCIRPQKLRYSDKSGRYSRSAVWRRGWDSNPRSRCRDACFPSMSIRPLSHLSALRSAKRTHLSMGVHDGQGEQRLCQPNLEMSSFSQSRNVRFMVSSPPWIVLVLAATACATDDSASA